MNGIDELTASGAVGVQPSSRAAFTVIVSCTAVATVEFWDSVATDADGNAKRKLTVICPANDTRGFLLHRAAFGQGLYVKFVSGTGTRCSVVHGA